MKLKKIHFLLIAMSLFLLISIGSVCAQEDSAIDADTTLSDSESNIILSDDGDTPTDEGTTTDKISTTVDSEDKTIKDTEPAELPVTVKDNETQEIEVTKENLTVSEGSKSIKFDYNDKIISITDKLSVGNHSLVIKYLGNEKYNSSSKIILLSIFGNNTIQAPNSVNVNSSQVVSIPLNVTNGVNLVDIVKSDLKIELSYKEGNETKTVPISEFDLKNGIVSFKLENKSLASGTLTIKYLNETSKTITLNSIINARITVLNATSEYKNGYIVAKITDIDDPTNIIADESLTLTIVTGGINAGHSVKTDSEGIAKWNVANLYEFEMVSNSFNMKPLDIKTYNITVGVTNNKNIITTSNKTTMTIKKADVIIKFDTFKEVFGTDKKFKITAVFKSNGKPVPYESIVLTIPKSAQKTISVTTDGNGTATLGVSGLSGGTYAVSGIMEDSSRINSAKTNGNIVITKKPVVIKTSNVNVYYNTGNTATIKVVDKSGKIIANAVVKVVIDGKNYGHFRTTSKGTVTLTLSLGVGKHTMKVSMDNNEPNYQASTATSTINVLKHNAKFSAPAVTAYYKQGKYFTVKVISNKNKKVIYDAKVSVKVYVSKTKYYSYVGRTGLDGTIKIKIDFNPGTYKVVINGKDGKNYTVNQASSTIKVLKAPAKLTPTKLSAKYKASKNFNIKVINTKTKKIITGMKVGIKVYTGKSYKVYYATTNAKGIALFNTKVLSKGTHKVVVYSANKYCTAKTATSTIKITK